MSEGEYLDYLRNGGVWEYHAPSAEEKAWAFAQALEGWLQGSQPNFSLIREKFEL